MSELDNNDNKGLPNRIRRITWVEMKYQTNKLSKEPGGFDIVVENVLSEANGYRRIKYPANYLETILYREIGEKNKVIYDALEVIDKVMFIKSLIKVIYIRNPKTEIFEEIWNSETSSILPHKVLLKFNSNPRKYSSDEIDEALMERQWINFDNDIQDFNTQEYDFRDNELTAHIAFLIESTCPMDLEEDLVSSTKLIPPKEMVENSSSTLNKRKLKKLDFLNSFSQLSAIEQVRLVIKNNKPLSYYPKEISNVPLLILKELTNSERIKLQEIIRKEKTKEWEPTYNRICYLNDGIIR